MTAEEFLAALAQLPAGVRRFRAEPGGGFEVEMHPISLTPAGSRPSNPAPAWEANGHAPGSETFAAVVTGQRRSVFENEAPIGAASKAPAPARDRAAIEWRSDVLAGIASREPPRFPWARPLTDVASLSQPFPSFEPDPLTGEDAPPPVAEKAAADFRATVAEKVAEQTRLAEAARRQPPSMQPPTVRAETGRPWNES